MIDLERLYDHLDEAFSRQVDRIRTLVLDG